MPSLFSLEMRLKNPVKAWQVTDLPPAFPAEAIKTPRR